MHKEQYCADSLALLKSLIQIPSYSKEEKEAADFLEKTLVEWGLMPFRHKNNIWVKSDKWQSGRPVVLLNSHIDTVRPEDGWRYDPHIPKDIDGKIIGLGSNDAGASLVSLLAVFRSINRERELPFNLIYCASAEEENSGGDGIISIIPEFGHVDFAIVGEPTQMQMAVAEKGLLVVDCEASGKTGHAAREEGENAIYIALDDIRRVKDFIFPKKSELLGAVKMTVTQIDAGSQHNVVPGSCRFVIDVRTNECYSNEEVYGIIKGLIQSEVKARSFRLNSSRVDITHPFVVRGKKLGLEAYGSPTTSDQAVMPFSSVKIGPGDSARSHTANEYIMEREIRDGIGIYIDLLDNLHL